MKKIDYIKKFKIEEALVKQIKLDGDDLIITVVMNINIFAMGNNIREEEIVECLTTYIFKHAQPNVLDLSKITHIYDSYLVGDSIILETNMGMLKLQTEEIMVKEEQLC